MFLVLALIAIWFYLLEKQIFRSINFHQLRQPQLYSDFSSVPVELQPLVAAGRVRASQSRLVICGLACNLADALPAAQRTISGVAALFRDYRIVVFENNSRDQTRQLLRAWSEHEPRLVLLLADDDHKQQSLYDFGTRSGSRLQRMAAYRNRYLDWIKQHAADWELALVLDLDMKGGMALDGFLHSLAFDWDAVAANGRTSLPGSLGLATFMYDDMPLLPANTEPSHNPGLFNVLSTKRLRTEYQLYHRRDLLPVRSAFNGAVVYKVSSLCKGSYGGAHCEHLGLHESMRARGCASFYINPLWELYGQIQGPTVAQSLKRLL